MKKVFFVFTLALLLVLTASCKDESVLSSEQKHQFVISWYNDNDSYDPDWFKVVDVGTKRFQPVPAVMELEGRYYLPVMSRTPSFQNKVVEGEFFIDQPLGSPRPDTVFRVTKHVRDTLKIY